VGEGPPSKRAGLLVRLERMIEARVSRGREFFEGMVPVQAFSKITLTLAPPKPLLLLMIR